MKKEFVLSAITICLVVLVFMFSGCKGEELKPDIEEKFRGKWETQSITVTNPYLMYGGVQTFTLPATIGGTKIDSQGYLIEATSMIMYRNGVIYDTIPEVYSRGDRFYGDINWSMSVNGNEAQISGGDYANNLIKVNKFSWE